MWVEEAYPEYAYEDPDYEDAENISDVRILRLVKTYHDLVSQRYDNNNPYPYKNFKRTPEGRNLKEQGKRYYKGLMYIGDRLKDRDPALFMAFVFGMWENRKHYHVYKHLGWKETPGVQFPSMYVILEYKRELVKLFMAKKAYRPKNFIPQDEHRSRRREAMAGKVKRWCSCFEKTPWDYWMKLRHLHPDLISARDLDHAESFWELDERFQKEFGVSAQEIRDNLEKSESILERERDKLYKKTVARNNKLRAQGLPSQYDHVLTIPNEEIFDEYTLLRIDYCQTALNEGIDVTTEEFEREMEDAINPIDYDNPDTVVYYHYGVGDGPRRKDGSLSG